MSSMLDTEYIWENLPEINHMAFYVSYPRIDIECR